MSIYDETQQIVREILGDPDFKQGSTQLLQIVPGSGSVDDPGPPVESVHEIDGAVRGVRWQFVQSGLAVATDMQITHSVVDGLVPTIKDFIIADGKRFKIVSVQAKPAVGTPVAYTLILRK